MELKEGHVLFTSLLVAQAGFELAAAIERAVESNVVGCVGAPGLAAPFASLAAAINDTISAGALEDTLHGSGLLLATDKEGR